MSDDDKLLDLSRLLDGIDNSDRMRRQNEQHEKEAHELLREVLAVLDSLRELERHCMELEAAGQTQTHLRTVQTISKQVLRLLGGRGVVPMDATGTSLDLTRHEVIGLAEEAAMPADIVLVEKQYGYMIGERVLRQAKVVVSR